MAVQTSTTFITGFPGFLGKRLIRKLAQEQPQTRFILLIQERMYEAAEDAMLALEPEVTGLSGRWELLPGDITERNLGLSEEDYARLCERVHHVWHLAALYNLSVEESVAYRVNVVGTIHILDLCEACPHLKQLNYVSTCYVSGQRTGLIREVELDEGQDFKNHYESTKFWAEVEVQRRMEKIPACIFRPGIIVGDSQTGHTDKYDGPYPIIRLMLKMPDVVPLPNIGVGTNVVNLVPVDYVIEAAVTIAHQPEATGQIYQLADPNPMQARDIVTLMRNTMGKAPTVGKLPPFLVRGALRLKPLRQALDLPGETVAYFSHDARYDSTNAQEALAETPVRCPHLSTYLDTLINYVERHPHKPA